MKRRYYDERTLSKTVRTLLSENLLQGSVEQPRIQPLQAGAVREEVHAAEEEIFGQRLSLGGTYEAGEQLEAWQELRRIVGSASQSVWIEDAWLGSDVVALFGEDLPDGVALRVLGPEQSNRHWNGALASLKRLGKDIPGRIEVLVTTDVHDRYVYVDGKVWRSSESFKDMAASRSTKLVSESENADTLIEDFKRRWAEATKVYPT